MANQGAEGHFPDDRLSSSLFNLSSRVVPEPQYERCTVGVATKPELVADLVAAVRDEMLVIPCEHNRRDSELGVA